MMRPPLEIDSWKRRGHTMLWDAGSLASLCHAEQAVTLRRFLRMHGAGWPEAELEGATSDGVLDGILAAVPVPR